ncbi:hypothetical protein FQA39_LY04088 [Lamprigera yunnana]|nr:hypothetical protein FQA39_LY04088 [Lamprigera yunnana]
MIDSKGNIDAEKRERRKGKYGISQTVGKELDTITEIIKTQDSKIHILVSIWDKQPGRTLDTWKIVNNKYTKNYHEYITDEKKRKERGYRDVHLKRPRQNGKQEELENLQIDEDIEMKATEMFKYLGVTITKMKTWRMKLKTDCDK